MTAATKSLTGAPLAYALNWDSINWKKVVKQVKRLQMRIAKATRENKHGKVKALQWMLTHSFYAKLMAVKRVTQNQGRNTPGIDNIVWRTSSQKMKAALSITRKGYKPKPLKRIYIPKKKGKRPLSIPAMSDRSQQALHLLALEPVVETMADPNSYGFRPKRSAADAIEQCHLALCRRHSAQWVFSGDIKACFDKISHKWLIKHTPMDKQILGKWLTSGYIEEGAYHQTLEGTPQGGIISAALLLVTLSGLEKSLKQVYFRDKDKVNVVVYADDFIITGSTREILEEGVIPKVEEFLGVRGLELSKEKSKIVHIDEGFDFLGFSVRKYQGKLLTKPSKENVKSFLKEIRRVIKSQAAAKQESLIHLLNPKIKGWANYFRHSASSRTFTYIDYHIDKALYSWVKRRHSRKGVSWRQRKYYRTRNLNHWIFTARVRYPDSSIGNFDLAKMGDISVRRYIKIRSAAHPYDPAFKEYFQWRSRRKYRS